MGTKALIMLLLVGLLNANYLEGSTLVVLRANTLSGYNNCRDKPENLFFAGNLENLLDAP